MESKKDIPQYSACYYCGKKDRCPYVAADIDDCMITQIEVAQWIVGTEAFRTSYLKLKSLNEAACDTHLSYAIKELQAIFDLSRKSTYMSVLNNNPSETA